jgi:hypothetical protein
LKSKARSSPRGTGGNRNVSTDSTSYAIHTNLQRPGTKKWKDITLLEQPRLVQKVVKEAIEYVTLDVFFRCAWPSITHRPIFGRPLLLAASEHLQGQYPHIADISARLGGDDDYTSSLTYLVSVTCFTSLSGYSTISQLVNRLALLRGPAKRYGGKAVPLFKLGLGEECKGRVAALFLDSRYVFPGLWRHLDGKETNVCCFSIALTYLR